VNVFACNLQEEALIHLRGANIAAFLQGQLTCDMRLLAEDRAVAGAFCNPKGRVLCDLEVLQVNDQHSLLRLRRSLAQTIADTLQRYAQFSRISVEPDARPTAVLGLYGDMNRLSTGSFQLADTTEGVVSQAGLATLRHGSSLAEIIAVDDADDLRLREIADALPAGTEDGWQAESLALGHYALEETDSGLFTPQALNYDLSGRVAFDKGCYTGQEVVARLHYKGQSKRRLAIYEASELHGTLRRDAPLLAADGETVGSCLRSATDRFGRRLLAAQVKSAFLDQQLDLTEGGRLTPLASLRSAASLNPAGTSP
jgi:folate-binding protein YgfZ